MHTPAWSTTLFFWTQRQIGIYPWLDRFMRFCAVWLIWIFGFATLAYEAVIFDRQNLYDASVTSNGDLLGSLFALGMIMGGFIVWGFVVSWVLALFFREKRPETEQAGVKTLIRPFQMFKSFPSDHAMVATILVAFLLSQQPLVVVALSVLSAACVMAGRVYVGAHYPHDIVGGIIAGVLALATARIFFLLV